VDYYEMFENLPKGANVFSLGLKERVKNVEQLIEKLKKVKKEEDDGLLRHSSGT